MNFNLNTEYCMANLILRRESRKTFRFLQSIQLLSLRHKGRLGLADIRRYMADIRQLHDGYTPDIRRIYGRLADIWQIYGMYTDIYGG